MDDAVRGAAAYDQIADRIREQIKSGRYPVGERLPVEHVLAVEFGVSRVTVNKAVHQLIDEGWLQVHRGVGVFVKAPFIFDTREQLLSYVEQSLGAGHLVLVRSERTGDTVQLRLRALVRDQ